MASSAAVALLCWACAGGGENVKPADATKDAATQGKAAAQGAATQAKDTAQGAATQAKDTAQGAATQAKDTAQGAATQAKDAAQGAATQAKNAAQGAATQAKDAAKDAARQLPQSVLQQKDARVLALPPTSKPAVAIRLRFRTGSVDDPPGQAGITNLAAAVMAEGGTEKLSSKELLQALFPIAADLDVRVDREQTTFFAKVHRDALGQLVPILTDVVLHPRWDEREFARIKDQVINDIEKRLRQADVENLGKEALAEAMYKGHAYERLRLGHVADLRKMTLADVKQHAQRVFTKNKLTIGIAGGYPEELPKQLEQTLDALPSGAAPQVVAPAQPRQKPRFLLVEKPGASTAISMGYPYPFSRASPDWPAMSIARSAMGEHRQFNGRLMNRLREARGLNYGDYAYIEHFQQQGGDAATAQLGRARSAQDFTVWLRPVQNENRLFAVRAALSELSRSVRDEPFSEAEVAQTKGFLDGYLLLFDQTDERKLGYALDDDFLGTPDFLKAWRAALPAVTPAQVNAAWQKWIDPSKLQIVMVGPDMATVKKAILAGEPTPVQYQRDASGNVPEKPKEQLARDREIAAFPFGAQGEDDVQIVPVGQLFQ